MKKNGFTVLELIVSFTLAATIGFFLLKITMVIKDLYNTSMIRTNIINKQNIITERMYDDFLYNDVKVVLKCGTNCVRFIFSDNTEKKFKISEDTFIWGDFTLKLTDESIFHDVELKNINTSITNGYDDSIISIRIPITNDNIKDTKTNNPESFVTNIVIPYKKGNVYISDLDLTSDDGFEYYMDLKDPGTTFLDIESTFTDSGVYAYYKEDTCTMKNPVNRIDENGKVINYYTDLKNELIAGNKTPKEFTFEGGEICQKLKVRIDYSAFKFNDKEEYQVNNTTQKGEYDIKYTLIIDGVEQTEKSITRHVTAFRKVNKFTYTENYKEFKIPMSGYYKIEVWGAKGVYGENNYGAYATGTARFLSGEKIYVYVGQTNNTQVGTIAFNANASTNITGYSGGGATDIRTSTNPNTRFIVAGGGGSGEAKNGGYGTKDASSYVDSKIADSLKSPTTCGAGGGYKVYGAVSCSDMASGGTSYVANDFMLNNRKIEFINNNNKYNKNIIAGNAKMINPYTGSEINHGNESDGYAIITFIGDKLD